MGRGDRNLPADKPNNRYTTITTFFLFFASSKGDQAGKTVGESCVKLFTFGG